MSFVDTNVLVHSSTSLAPFHGRAQAALAGFVANGPVSISRQILREYLSVMTRPQVWSSPLSLAQATVDTDGFIRRFRVLEDGPPVWNELMSLRKTFVFGGRQVHDANIVATMRAYGKTRILTFNVADFRRFGGLIQIVAP